MNNEVKIASLRLYVEDLEEFKCFASNQDKDQKDAFHKLMEIAKKIKTGKDCNPNRIMVFVTGTEGKLYDNKKCNPLKRFYIVGYPILFLQPYYSNAIESQEELRKIFHFHNSLNTHTVEAVMNVFYDSIKNKYLIQDHLVIYDEALGSKDAVLFSDRYFFADSYEDIKEKIPSYISMYNKTMLKRQFQEIQNVKDSEIENTLDEYYNL